MRSFCSREIIFLMRANARNIHLFTEFLLLEASLLLNMYKPLLSSVVISKFRSLLCDKSSFSGVLF